MPKNKKILIVGSLLYKVKDHVNSTNLELTYQSSCKSKYSSKE